MARADKPRLVDGKLVIPSLTPREQAEALMKPDIFEAMSIFVTLSDEDKKKALAEAHRLMVESLKDEAGE